jgi:hypothetical protein
MLITKTPLGAKLNQVNTLQAVAGVGNDNWGREIESVTNENSKINES